MAHHSSRFCGTSLVPRSRFLRQEQKSTAWGWIAGEKPCYIECREMVFLDGLLGMRTWYCWFDDRYIPWVQCTLVEVTVLLRNSNVSTIKSIVLWF